MMTMMNLKEVKWFVNNEVNVTEAEGREYAHILLRILKFLYIHK